MSCRSRQEILVAGVKVATQTPPVRSGRRVVFVTLDDATGPLDATFFEDAQAGYASTVFHSWLLVIRGFVRRTGPRGVSLRATGCWELPAMRDAWEVGGIPAVEQMMATPAGVSELAVQGAAASRSSRPVMASPPMGRARRSSTPPGSGCRRTPTSSRPAAMRAAPRAGCGTPVRGAPADESGRQWLRRGLWPGTITLPVRCRERPPAPGKDRVPSCPSQSTQSGSWPAARSSVVWEDLRRALGELADRRGRELAVVDAGGGSGGFAVPLAQLGHRVIVVDPSPDSLASLERRAAEAGVGDRVSGRQGDLDTLGEAVGPEQADVLLCHDVLEIADDPRLGLAAIAVVLRPGGLLSLLAANRSAAVLGRVLAGRLDAAEIVLAGGTTGTAPTAPHAPVRSGGARRASSKRPGCRCSESTATGCSPIWCPARVLDTEPHAREILQRLEEKVARLPAYQAMATRLHLLARPTPEADRRLIRRSDHESRSSAEIGR